MYNATEDQLDRLRSPDVTVQDVMEYLECQEAENLKTPATNGAPHYHPDQFFAGEADLQSFKQAQAWWPKGEHVPAAHVCPSLFVLCWRYEWGGMTFAERLTQRATPVVRWLESEGLSVENPNESEEDRKLRLNRESVQRHRVRKGVAGTPEQQAHEQAVAGLYAGWQAAIAARGAALAGLDQRVRDAEIAYHAVCAERKAARITLDAGVAAARKAYHDGKKGAPPGTAE